MTAGPRTKTTQITRILLIDMFIALTFQDWESVIASLTLLTPRANGKLTHFCRARNAQKVNRGVK
jgi:hypothetical protein